MENIKIINPYEDYEVPQMEQADGVYGNDLLGRVQSLQVGFGTKVLRIDRDGLWMGSEDFATAPFSVDMDGNMSATSLDLSDYLQVGEALDDLQGDIFDLSDINDDLGTIVAGTLVGLTVIGGTIKTSNSGERVEMNGSTNTLRIIDSGGTVRAESYSNGIQYRNSSGSVAGRTFVEPSLGYFAIQGVNNDVLIQANDDITFAPGGGGITAYIDGGTKDFFVTSGDLRVTRDIFCDDIFGDNIECDIIDCDQVGGAAGSFTFTGSAIWVDEEISPTSDNVHDLGDPGEWWNDLYATDINYDNLVLGSDRRLKKNIADSQYGLTQIKALRPVTYNYKMRDTDETTPRMQRLKAAKPERYQKLLERATRNKAEKRQVQHLGLIAQDVASVMPELVHVRKDGMLGLRSTEIIPVLVRAVQELSDRVDALENKSTKHERKT